jgi:hypothetical protein
MAGGNQRQQGRTTVREAIRRFLSSLDTARVENDTLG